MNDQLVAPNIKQKGLKALDRQMLSYIAPPIMFPVHGFPGFCVPRMRYAETLKEPMLEVKRKAVLPRELRRIRASALTGDKKYGSVMDVLQIVYGQDFGAILKDYVDTHQEELYKRGIMPDSLFTRLGGIGKPYIETNYDQPSKAFFLDVVVDCLLDGEHYQRCVSFYIRYKMSFCAMAPRCFLWEIGLYRSDVDDELRDTNRTKADGNLLPKITAAKYDEIVDDLLESYNPEALDAPGPVDVYKIADGMKLAVRELLIPDYNILGQLHFWPGTIEYLDKDGSKKVSRANSLDIFINKLSCSTMVAKRSSLAHEIGHLFCSRMFELLQIMAGNKHGAVVNKRKKQLKGADIPKELESQPSKFSGHLLLPRRTALLFVEEEIRKLGGHASPRQMEAIVRKVMDTFQVSRQMATLRLKDFGYDVAKGINRYVDGHYIPAYGTSNGEWKNGVDYIIEHKAVFELYFDDAQFREVINTGRFVFVENHLCLADRRYIRMGAVQKLGSPRVWLTDYARNHIDECCLAFRERGVSLHRYYDGVLNREICKRVVDYRYDPMRTREENIQLMDEYARITDGLPSGFGQTVKYHMSRVGVRPGDLAEEMELDSKMVQYFRKELEPVVGILPPKEEDASKNKNHLTKRSVVTMALLMHLMPDWSDHLLEQAHYILDRSDREEKVEMLYGSVPSTLSELIRTALIPKQGCRFIVADFSAIEARVLAWLAGEEWVLDEFSGAGKIYEATASRMYHVPKESIVKGNPNYEYRQKGKQATLSCGYGGGVGALKNMGAKMPEDEMQPLVDAWRAANPHIVGLWNAMDRAMRKVIREHSSVRVGKIRLYWKDEKLLIRLPSGRELCYLSPRTVTNRFGSDGIGYMAPAANGQLMVQETFGGKACENVTQATARDILAHAMLNLEAHGYNIVFHVHDECVMEMPEGTGSVEEACAIMGQTPEWCSDLPLRADGYECRSYRKA